MNSSKRLIISVDLDEWYHSRWATGSEISIWENTEIFFREYYKTDKPIGELKEPTKMILDIFDRFDVKATFFVLGEIANWYPNLVKEIHSKGHEIACHGLRHIDIFCLSPQQFTKELKQAKDILESLIGEKIIGYRAPNLIMESWVIDILEDLGFKYDSSICPSRPLMGKFKGLVNAPLNPYRLSMDNLTIPGERDIIEIPIPTFPIIRLPAATGIMTRVIGLWWTQIAIKNAMRTGDAMYYFHPYELADKPAVNGLNLRNKLFLRHTGKWMEHSIQKLFRELKRNCQFVNARQIVAEILGEERN